MSDMERKDLREQGADQAAPQAAQAPEQEQEEMRHIELGEDLRKKVKRRKVMSGKKKLLIGLGCVVLAAVLVVGLYLLLALTGQEEITETTDTKVVFIDEGYAGLDAIQISNENGDFTVRNISTEEEEFYALDGMDDDVLRQDGCVSLYTAMGALYADEMVTETATDLSAYGLDDPRAVMTITLKDGSTRNFLLGDEVPTSAQSYFCEEGKPEVYVISSYLSEKMLAPVADYHIYTMPEVDAENGKSLVIQMRGEEPWKIRLFDDTGNTLSAWKMIDPYEIDVDFETVQNLVTDISEVTLSRFVATAASQEDLATYGLDDPIATLTYVDQNNASRTVIVGDKTDTGNYYVQIDDSLDVYLAVSGQVSFVENITLVNLLDSFANLINIAYVDQVEITKGTESYRMQIKRQESTDEDGNTVTEETYFLNGKQMDEDMFKDAYQTIISVTHSGLSDETKVGEGVVLSVRFTFNNGTEDLLVEYYPYDINNYAISRNGNTFLYGRKDRVDEIWPTLQQLEAGTLNTED